jgi:arylsulfatase A-like enzyme
MKRRNIRLFFQAIVIIVGLGFIGFILYFTIVERDKGKSILLIVADTLRADHLGCYGFDLSTSPNIDRLAARGITFDRFYTVVPSTLASVTSMMTSLYPKDHGAFRNGFKGHENLQVLGDIVREKGYETAAFVASYCLSKKFGMDKGFDIFSAKFTKRNPSIKETIYCGAKTVTNNFLKWVRDRDIEEPFFAMVHYFDPHWPYDPPTQYMKFFDVKKMSEYDSLHPEQKPSEAPSDVPPTGKDPSLRELNFHGLYCAEIRFMDAQIGRIMQYLEDSGLLKDTIVIFVSDHGETFWEHDDLFNHGLFVYDTTIRVPMIISCPGFIPEGTRVDDLLSTLDLAPTICELAGTTPPSVFEGKSFKERLYGIETLNKREVPVFSEATMPFEVEEGALRPNIKKAKCVCYGPWKYVVYPTIKNRKELFNVINDPMERNNLINNAENAALIDMLDPFLIEWAYRFRNRKNIPVTLDDDVQSKLNELGY